MRHGNKVNHLGRTASHRGALLNNMAISLIRHKRIETTVAKAKELRKFVEPLITRSKNDTTHSRRIVFSYLQDKEAVSILFREIAGKINDRPGGYTRILKTGTRQGDAADMCLIELVDYNETMMGAKEEKKAKSTRTRRGKKKTEGTEAEEKPATEKKKAAPKAKAKKEEEPAAETEEEVKDEAPAEDQEETNTEESDK